MKQLTFKIVRTIFRASLLISIFSKLVIAASADENQNDFLNYGTFRGYALAKGILGNDFYATPKPSCITGTTNSSNASHGTISVSIVFNASQYKEAFHVDAKAQASYMAFNGGADVDIKESSAFNNSAFDIIMEDYSEQPTSTIDNIDWDDVHKPLASSGSQDALRQLRSECGDRYISSVFNESRLYLVIKVANSSSLNTSSMSANIHGGFNMGVAQASAALGGDSQISKAHQEGSLHLDVISEGYPNASVGVLKIGAADGLQAIANAVDAYLTAQKDPKPQPVKYALSPLPYPNYRGDQLSDDRFFKLLSKLKLDAATSQSRLANIDQLGSGVDPRTSLYSSKSASLQKLELLRPMIEDYDEKLESAHKTCRQALELKECQDAVQSTGVPPPFDHAELPPAFSDKPTQILPYDLYLDGNPKPNPTLILNDHTAASFFDAAKSLEPTVGMVEISAPIVPWDISDMIVLVGQPTLAARFPSGVGGIHVDGNLLKSSTDATSEHEFAPSLNIVRASSAAPCPRPSAFGFIRINDETCLSLVGRTLREAAIDDMVEAAVSDINFNAPSIYTQMPHNYTFPVQASFGRCFGQRLAIGIANADIKVSAPNIPNMDFFSDSTKISATVTVSVVLSSGDYIPILEYADTHTLSEWKNLKKKVPERLSTFERSLPTAPSVCRPHL